MCASAENLKRRAIMDVATTTLDGVSDKIEKIQSGSFHIHFIRRLNMTDCENGAQMRAGERRR